MQFLILLQKINVKLKLYWWITCSRATVFSKAKQLTLLIVIYWGIIWSENPINWILLLNFIISFKISNLFDFLNNFFLGSLSKVAETTMLFVSPLFYFIFGIIPFKKSIWLWSPCCTSQSWGLDWLASKFSSLFSKFISNPF